jgi:xylulose-5-phosphate/fructose-6-phosphate phosphoketolase
VLDRIIQEIRLIQSTARSNGFERRPAWPMIILRTPKGWTGPEEVDGLKTEGSWRSHQVPLANLAGNPKHLEALEEWMRSYRPEELFDKQGRLIPELAELAPTGIRRMGANPYANGGLLAGPAFAGLPGLRD